MYITPTAFGRHLSLGIYVLVEQREFWLPRIEAFCSYKALSRFGDVLEISLSIEEIKEKTVEYGFSVNKEDSDVTVAEGYAVAANANKKTRKAISVPSGIIEKLKAFRNS